VKRRNDAGGAGRKVISDQISASRIARSAITPAMSACASAPVPVALISSPLASSSTTWRHHSPSVMNASAKTFVFPLGGDEHHQAYAPTNVRKTLDTTLRGDVSYSSRCKAPPATLALPTNPNGSPIRRKAAPKSGLRLMDSIKITCKTS